MPVLTLAVGAHLQSSDGQPDRSKIVCPLSDTQTKDAIQAFDRLMPVFHHDHCANCHNKIDPFAPRAHIDVRAEFERYRDRPVLAQAMKDVPGRPDIGKAHQAVLQFLSAVTLTQRQRNAVVFANACSVCHDPPPARSAWIMAPPTDSFHDKDRVQLCRHIHTNNPTGTPREFERHMATDEFTEESPP